MVGEYFVPARKGDDDESLAGFVRRRLGNEVYDRLVQPLIGGIYTADPEVLSVDATMSRFREMEVKYGGLIRGMRRQASRDTGQKQSSGARYSMFMTLRGGMRSLVDAIVEDLPNVTPQLNSPVQDVQYQTGGKWKVTFGEGKQLDADGVVVALPASRATEIMTPVDEQLGRLLADVHHSPCAVICLGYRREQIAHALDGFGFVVPSVERRSILSVSFSSVKYAERAPDDCELLRIFVGGATQPELVELPDDQLLELVRRELRELMGVQGEPLFTDVGRWYGVMPQYRVGHRGLIEKIEQRCEHFEGLQLAGNSFDGVGLPNCIHRAQIAADRLVQLANTKTKAPSS